VINGQLTGKGRTENKLDDRLLIEDLGGKIRITYRMKRTANYANLAFFLVWSIPFFAVFIWLAIDSLTQGGDIWPLLFLVPFMVLGAFAINHFLFGLIGKMIIELEAGAMAVYKKPRQIRGRKSFPWGTIRQTYVKDDYIESSGRNRNNARTVYALMVETSAGKRVKIIGEIDLAESASKMEKAIECALRINDQRVAEESPLITTKRLEENVGAISDEKAQLQRASLTKASIGLRPYYYLSLGEGGKVVGSLLPKGRFGINKQIIWTVLIVVVMMLVITIMTWGTNGFLPQLLFLPLVLVGIIVIAIISTGTMRYESQSGSFVYNLGRKTGSINTMEWSCLDEKDGSCKMMASGNEIRMEDGTTYFYNAGSSFGSGNRERSYGYRTLNISIFKKEGDQERPVLLVEEKGGNSPVDRTFLYDATEKNIDQLLGFAMFLFHSYTGNVNLTSLGRSGRNLSGH
jgi:hypothetical protein